MAENWFQEEFDNEPPRTVAELATDVVYRVPNCADVTVRRALSNAYWEFCRRSSCLRHFRIHEMREGVADYPVIPWCGGRVDSVQRVSTRLFVLRENADYIVVDGDVVMVRLLPVPGASQYGTERLRIDFVEQPPHGSERASRWFLEQWGHAVVSGALAEIYSMQNTPWYRPEVAIAERRAFQDAIGTAKMRGLSGASAGSGRMTAPDFSTLAI